MELYNESNSCFCIARQEGIARCDICLARNPNDIRVLNKKAFSLANISNFEEAKTIIDEVLGIKPEYARALDTKGFNEAKVWLEKAYDKNSTLIGTYEHMVGIESRCKEI
jgi:hypothetical protein